MQLILAHTGCSSERPIQIVALQGLLDVWKSETNDQVPLPRPEFEVETKLFVGNLEKQYTN